ncbi:MAG: AAA family ATPase [Paracoccaceae bacterium]
MNQLHPEPFIDPAKGKRQFTFIRASDLEFKEPEFIVEGLIETDSLALVFGEPACGKSFLALDIGACISTGKATTAAIITHYHFPIRPRTLERWPLTVRRPNKAAIYEVAEALACAEAKLNSAYVYKQAEG